jgi:hypothetical protein
MQLNNTASNVESGAMVYRLPQHLIEPGWYWEVEFLQLILPLIHPHHEHRTE